MKTLLILLFAGIAWSQDLAPDPRWSNLQGLDVQAMTFSARNEMYIFGQFAAPYRAPRLLHGRQVDETGMGIHSE